MKYLSHKAIKQMCEEMTEAAQDPQTWNSYCESIPHAKATLLFPAGELSNERISGYVWAWAMTDQIQTCPIPDNVRLNAHGLEGAVKIQTSLITALTVYKELPPFRCAISRD